MADHTPIDFTDLNAALLERADTLVPLWLPGGRRHGREWVCGGLHGGEGSSCSVNLDTGRWADFANDEDRGGDLVSLYAAIHGLNNGQAARQLMRELGWERAAPPAAPARAPASSEPPPWVDQAPPADEPAPAGAAAKRETVWKPVAPVPAGTPRPLNFRHYYRGEPETVWEYSFEGELYGFVCRYATSDGGKDILPFTWCEDTGDGRGTRKWTFKQWDEPRPLYVPATLLSADLSLPVVVVEGEKCALAGHKLLGHEFDFVSWPGGAKAWARSGWRWLMGRAVYLWPDCDAKRQRLTKEERDAGLDPATKPLLPEARQPGMAAMIGIGSLLLADHGCTVFMCKVPAPGDISDGWDIADAIASGWDADQVRAFIRGAVVFVAPDDAARAKGAPTPRLAGAEPDEAAHAWRAKLITSEKGGIKPVRENVVLALDGIAGGPQGIAEAQGVIAFNELTNDVVKAADSPWGTPEGAWAEVDDLLLGEWLVREHWLPSMPRGTLEEAVQMVAYRHRYHPIRDWLQGLRWDGTPRLRTWLARACLEEDEWDHREPLQRYLARVGTFYLMAMCARIINPGVKFDYMLILEGQQGMRKSTLLRTLAGEYFADTGLVLGDKDSYQQLQGVWLYEIPELDAFSKADVQKIKAYVASQEDYFRASFDRRAAKYKRQLVFAGTTNEDHYLTDPTGNRRFWPVRVTRLIDIDWVTENREQLFAEAMARLAAGARMFPTPEEELVLFVPQQQHRTVDNAIESAIGRYLYPPDGALNAEGLLVYEITLVELLGKVGIGVEKLGPGRFHEKQAAAALRRLGWVEKRSARPGRPRMYVRPTGSAAGEPGGSDSTRRDADAPTAGADDDCPF